MTQMPRDSVKTVFYVYFIRKSSLKQNMNKTNL